MALVDRLKQYMEYMGLPSTQFADVAKIARPTISQILSGRNRKISNEVLEKLHAAFPKLNIMWLLFGDGDMEMEANNAFSQPQNGQNLFSVPYQASTNQSFTSANTQNQASQISLQSSNIEEFVEENRRNSVPATENQETAEGAHPAAAALHTAAAGRDSGRRIQSIMVFYTDSSYEIFTPSVQIHKPSVQ